VGGIGAVWIRSREQAGTVLVKATHPLLGERQATIEISPAPEELA
jgi:beta-galactosidase